MERIVKGVARFQNHVFPEHQTLFEELKDAQKPQTLFITCADSRVVPQLITQSGPGDMFICRNAGNMIPPYGEVHGGVSATIEYALGVLNIEYIIVCGHSDCGAMKGILYPDNVKHLPTVATWLHHGEAARRIVEENHPQLTEAEKLVKITEENVIAQLNNLRTHPLVAARLARGALEIHGWLYDIATGHVATYDAASRSFRPLTAD